MLHAWPRAADRSGASTARPVHRAGRGCEGRAGGGRADGDADIESRRRDEGDALMPYLPKGLPVPVIEDDRLDAPYWQATREHKLKVQRCARCRVFQWGPEWL